MPIITNGMLPGPAGPIEYVLTVPEPDELRAPIARGAVLSHPHPLFGGTMHTRIVFHLSRALAALGMPVLRYQFRGVGKSAGTHAHGIGERDDLAAAIAWMRQSYPLPLVLGGFSFGATVTVGILARQPIPEVERVVLVGLPVDRAELPVQWSWRGPKFLISGDADEFASHAARERYFAALPEPKRRVWIAGADHFVTEHMDEFRRVVEENLDFA